MSNQRSQNKKLLLVGSASVHVLNFYHLVKEFFDEVLIASNDSVFGDLPYVNVDFNIRNPLQIPSNIKKMKSVIEEFKPDIIHIHQANSVAWITLKAASGFSIPTVLSAWGDDILVHPHQNAILKIMVRFNLAKANYLTSDSLYMAGEMQKLVPEKSLKVTVANFGIEMQPLTSKKEKIIYSNRLHKPMYRVDAIIRAFAKFHRTHAGRDWRLFIAGSGTETTALTELVHSLKLESAVEFKGWLGATENIGNYQAASLFVSVPNSDATSVSLLEAMAYGCIPVLSNLPANLEWVLDGINGVIVKDLDGDFITPVFNINFGKAIELNATIITARATKEVSKAAFGLIYKKALQK
jgi:glycosyltransferase involved in cell wall biosynthesis